MHIAFLSPSGQIGGAERVLLDLIAVLPEIRPTWQLRLVTPCEGLLLERARALGAAVDVVPMPSSLARLGDAMTGSVISRVWLTLRLLWAAASSAAYVRRLRRVLADGAADLIHANGLKMHVLGARARGRTPLVWHLHDYVSNRPIMRRLLAGHAGHAAMAVANSDSVAADLRFVLNGSVAVRAIPNGVDLQAFHPDGPVLDVDGAAGLAAAPPGTVRVGLVAHFARWKGHLTFLDALARLPPDLPVRGYVVGGPVYETSGSQHSVAELRARAAALGLADRVGFTGPVEDVASALRAMDVVVHASTRPEPFGLVIAEAMACGRAVVASATGGAAELFTNNVDALGHPPGDTVALAGRIAMLATGPGLRRALGAAGRFTAERRFDRRRMVSDLASVYESLCAIEPAYQSKRSHAVAGQGA